MKRNLHIHTAQTDYQNTAKCPKMKHVVQIL